MADDSTAQLPSPPAPAKGPAPSRRRLAAVALAAIAIGGLGFGGYRSLQYYRLRFLREADARLSIDDRAGAIEALRSQILNSPDDYPTQVRLAELYATTGQTDAAIRIYERVRTHWTSDSELLLRWQALKAEANLVETGCNEREQTADALVTSAEYPKALDAYADLIHCRESNPYFHIDLDSDSDIARAELDLHKAFAAVSITHAAWALDAPIVGRAYLYWISGDAERAERLVNEPVPLIDALECPYSADSAQVVKTWPALRRSQLAKSVSYLADDLLSSADSRGAAHAAEAFRFALNLRLQADGGAFDDESNRLQYKESIAEAAAGHHDRARVLLKEVSARDPDHFGEKARSLVQLMDRDSQTGELKRRLDAAAD